MINIGYYLDNINSSEISIFTCNTIVLKISTLWENVQSFSARNLLLVGIYNEIFIINIVLLLFRF